MDSIPRTDYYTYLLKRPAKPDSPKHIIENGMVVFYVGKGKGYRATSHESCAKNHETCHHRTCHIIRKVLREGEHTTMEKVCEGVSEKTAFRVERLMISIGRTNNWPLCNMTEGGDGISGYQYPDELKEVRRQHGLERYTDPEETEKSRQLTKDLWQTAEYRDKLLEIRKDPLVKAKISKAHKGIALQVQTYEGFVSPEHQIFAPVTNLASFCRDHSLSYCGMWLVTQNKQVSHQGWTRYYPPGIEAPVVPVKIRVSNIGNTNHAKTYEGFVAPDGITTYRDIYNLKAFCKTHELSLAKMSLVNSGKRPSHKGWTRYEPRIQPVQDRLFDD